MVKLRDLENWMSIGQVSRKLGRSRQGVLNIVDEGRIRGVKTQIGWLLDPASVEEFAEREGKKGVK
jgi:DNA-binding Lrp family transcriptional regulator